MNLGIGSAQFGMDYGISNRGGRTPPSEVRLLLEHARTAGVRIIDTAPLYGTAEEVLGQFLPSDRHFDVVTKTPSFAGVPETSRARLLESTFERSLTRLGTRRVYGLLAHHADDLLGPGGAALYEAMSALKLSGKVERIGASIYEPEQVDQLLERFAIDLIQVPLNVLDQRLVAGGYLERLKKTGVEIHARSAFLQGLLLMAPAELPPHFDPAKPLLRRYHGWLAARGLDALAGAVGFIAGLPHLDAAIFGVNTCRQFSEIIARSRSALDPAEFREFALNDRAIINPSLWPAQCVHSA